LRPGLSGRAAITGLLNQKHQTFLYSQFNDDIKLDKNPSEDTTHSTNKPKEPDNVERENKKDPILKCGSNSLFKFGNRENRRRQNEPNEGAVMISAFNDKQTSLY
jgi:hypothetical protein